MWVSGEAQGSQEETVLHPGARWLLRCWEVLRAGRPAPGRADLDLAQMPRLAPWLFILEPGAAKGWRYRLAGTSLCAFLGREVTGTDPAAGWERFERGVIDRTLAGVADHDKQAQLRLRFLTDRGEHIGADMPLLPLVARDGETRHVLGGLFPHGDPSLWQYRRLVPSELAAARFLEQGLASPVPEAEQQARRKFRVIEGGLQAG